MKKKATKSKATKKSTKPKTKAKTKSQIILTFLEHGVDVDAKHISIEHAYIAIQAIETMIEDLIKK